MVSRSHEIKKADNGWGRVLRFFIDNFLLFLFECKIAGLFGLFLHIVYH